MFKKIANQNEKIEKGFGWKVMRQGQVNRPDGIEKDYMIILLLVFAEFTAGLAVVDPPHTFIQCG